MHNPFLRLMRQTATLYRKTGVASDGSTTLASGTPLTCRVLQQPTRLVTATGDEVLATDVLWCPPDTALDVDDQVTLPDGRSAIVKMTEAAPDSQGVVYVQKGWCV